MHEIECHVLHVVNTRASMRSEYMCYLMNSDNNQKTCFQDCLIKGWLKAREFKGSVEPAGAETYSEILMY